MTERTSTSTSDAERGQVNTAAAEVYDAFFVPALFGQFPDPSPETSCVEGFRA